MERTRLLLILAHLQKLELVERGRLGALEEQVRRGMPEERLRAALVDEGGLDRPTLDVVWSSVDSTLAMPQRVTRVELKTQATGGRRVPRTAVEAKVRALEGDPTTSPERFSPPDLSSRYEFLELLGVGGMGVVHLARDNALKRRVAVKTLRPEFRADPRWIRSLMYEAVITGNLEHPSIVPVYDLGILPGGDFFYTMKVLDSATLRETLDHAQREASDPASPGRTHRKVPSDQQVFELLLAFRQIAAGIAYAHTRGVVHRDLKPSNINLGSHGEVSVLDWGIAMGIRGDWPRWREEPDGDRVIGTFEYSAPEQIMREDATPAFTGDVYSLGVILYEILTLRLPYGFYEGAAEVAERSHTPPPMPSIVAPGRAHPGLLDEICLRALHPDPTKRYPDASALLHDLDQFVSGARERRVLEDVARQEHAIAEGLLKEYVLLVTERGSVDASVGALERDADLFVAEDVRVEVARLGNRRKHIDVLASQRYTEILAHLNRARGYHPDSGAVNRTLFRLYRTRLEEARVRLDTAASVTYGALTLEVARMLDDPVASAEARLSIRSYPEGAEIRLASYADVSRDIRFEMGRDLGKTPVMDVAIPPGSYLVMARKPGFLDEHRFHVVLGGERANLLVTLSPLSISLGDGGRERELHQLQLALSDAMTQSRVKLVLVEGPAGSGTGHIANSFKDFLENLDYFVAFVSVDCRQLHQQVPFYVVSDMIKFRSGIRHGDARPDVRKRLTDMLLVPLTREGRVPLPRAVQDQLPQLVDMLGALPSIDIPSSEASAPLRRDPAALRERILWALQTYFEALGAWVPICVILHNAQWADPSSVAFLSRLRRTSRGRPMLVVALSETADADLTPAWRDAPLDARVRLRPLDHEATERTLAKLLNGAPSLDLVRFLLDRSGGLPTVTEHLVTRLVRARRLYRRQPDDEWVQRRTAERTPRTTMDDVIAEEIEGLTPAERHLLEVAAVVGRIFWREALVEADPSFSADALLGLVRRRLIVEHAHSRFPQTEEYTFTENRLRDRLYDQIPLPRRQQLHARAAEWLWKKYRGALEEVSLLGHHREGAGDEADAAVFFQRVGDTCRRYDALDEALANYQRVLALKVDPQRAEDVRAAIAEVEARLKTLGEG